MTDLQTRLEVQGATLQWVASFMQRYNIPAHMMEDALNKVLLQLKDQVVADLLSAAAQAQPMEEQAPAQEEENGEQVYTQGNLE